MMTKLYALVKKIDDNIEEEVTLELNGVELTCFAGVCPYQIQEGKEYPVSFELEIFDDYCVEELNEEKVALERIGNDFSYWVAGRLDGSVIHSVIQFEDEILMSDYGYLDGKFIRMKVDRIDVEFLKF
ncbi:hypothetical protein [Hahella sp. CCB-MM4]|uniref:hypothetical protein n=1 Tax=Hahella sp. (strain CCB-MM4) TaxID=1926491 RepID=UPI001AEF9668|nr:hypothetical protein [Hahella sp. CCB-MM4]